MVLIIIQFVLITVNKGNNAKSVVLILKTTAHVVSKHFLRSQGKLAGRGGGVAGGGGGRRRPGKWVGSGSNCGWRL